MIDKIKEWFTNKIVKKYVGSIARHLITMASGFLIASSFAGVEDLGQFIASNEAELISIVEAILLGVVGLALSFKEKKDKK